jgi:predicted ATPase
MKGANQGTVWYASGALVGRDELLGSILECLGANRLVTLTGVGGVGKTRLAIEVAATIGPRFRDGAWMVELAAVRDAAAVYDAIASTLDIAPRPRRR